MTRPRPPKPTPAERRFKDAVRALVRDRVYPGPVQIRRRLGREPGSQTIGGRETRWRAEVLLGLGWTARRWPHQYRYTWIPPAGRRAVEREGGGR